MFTHFKIEGNIPLRGEVEISGSKNAALPLMFSSLLTAEKVTIHNVPEISDIFVAKSILEFLGSEIDFTANTLTIDNKNVEYKDIPHNLVSKMRASVWLLGPLLARFKKCNLAFPGGCVIGKRPIGVHIKAMMDLGAEVIQNDDPVILEADNLTGGTVVLREMSVSATINAIMAATLAKGETTIKIAAPEPEVQELCNFLNTLGANITGIGTNTLHIIGVSALHGGEFTNMPDRIEAGTFACLAAFVDNSDIRIKGLRNDHLDMFWARMYDLGVNFTLENNNSATVKARPEYDTDELTQFSTTVDSRIYPHFPTDLQSPFGLLLTKAKGMTKIFDTIFEGRLAYLGELEKMGAKTQILNPHQAIIVGPSSLKGADLQSHDLRAGATVVLAALGAQGTSRISGINYIDRGYEKFEHKLRSLGARITRIEE